MSENQQPRPKPRDDPVLRQLGIFCHCLSMPSCDVPNHSNTSKPRKWHIDSWLYLAKCSCVWINFRFSSFLLLPKTDEGDQNLEEAKLASFFLFFIHKNTN